MTDPAFKVQSDFAEIERALVGWWDQPGVTVLAEFGEWYAEIDGHRYSISAQALAAAQALQGIYDEPAALQ
jgi:hypothetical protein